MTSENFTQEVANVLEILRIHLHGREELEPAWDFVKILKPYAVDAPDNAIRALDCYVDSFDSLVTLFTVCKFNPTNQATKKALETTAGKIRDSMIKEMFGGTIPPLMQETWDCFSDWLHEVKGKEPFMTVSATISRDLVEYRRQVRGAQRNPAAEKQVDKALSLVGFSR